MDIREIKRIVELLQRALTRMANIFWEKYDIIANEKMGKEEEL